MKAWARAEFNIGPTHLYKILIGARRNARLELRVAHLIGWAFGPHIGDTFLP